jgi:hypothetical protein
MKYSIPEIRFMKKVLLYAASAFSCFIIPAAVTASVVLTLLSGSWFYVSIIRNSDPVKTLIETRNQQTENEIKREVEKRTGLSLFMPGYHSLKREYENRHATYDTINRTGEFAALDRQIDEFDELEWVRSSDEFRTEKDFEAFRKEKMQGLKSRLKDIKKYRDDNEDAIEKAEDSMKEAKDRFEDARDTLEDKEKEARKIIESRRGEFMNEIYSDVARIEPVLSEKLDRLFLQQELKSVLDTYLNFMTSWKKQRDSGNIYTSRLNLDSGIIENVKKVVLPPLRINLKVREPGSAVEKNIMSEIFVDVIERTQGLRSPWVLIRIFKLSDSWIGEMAANSILKDTGVHISDGVIKAESPVLSGKTAERFEKMMMLLSTAGFMPFLAGGLALFLLAWIFFLSPDRRAAMRVSGSVLKYPSALMVLGAIALIIASFIPGFVIPPVSADSAASVFVNRLASVALFHVTVPVAGVFSILSIMGGILGRFGKVRKAV